MQLVARVSGSDSRATHPNLSCQPKPARLINDHNSACPDQRRD